MTPEWAHNGRTAGEDGQQVTHRYAVWAASTEWLDTMASHSSTTCEAGLLRR
jgi:hypothetical protein